ncbi:hypothetical protein NQ315_003712 [Exocentrus adspersus]|uniref:DNA-directed DNA polymerase n=1 Tax=Exocentrus adspersus TaxID=1586481 RepID=A0AAV8V620_9CUCU|nr:hypothetical protein NQ315_003712 [Exocentrus adspersus]
MIQFFKKGIRGGIRQCTAYLDATNLYGHSMSQCLPTGGFRWLTGNEMSNLNILDIPDEAPQGFALEVDVQARGEYRVLYPNPTPLENTFRSVYQKAIITIIQVG